MSAKDQEFLINEISNYVFDTKVSSKSGEKVFDYELDYKYYFYDFKKLGINLNKEDISWWEFSSILDGILTDKNSYINTVIGYRTYEKPPKNYKTSEEKEHKFYMEKKRFYALPKQRVEIDEALGKLYNYVKTTKKGVDDLSMMQK